VNEPRPPFPLAPPPPRPGGDPEEELSPARRARMKRALMARIDEIEGREDRRPPVFWAFGIAAALALIAATLGGGAMIAKRLWPAEERETAKGPPLKNSAPPVQADGGAPR